MGKKLDAIDKVLCGYSEERGQEKKQDHGYNYEDDGIAATTLQFPASLHKKMKIYAIENNTKMRDIVITAVTKYLETNK